MSIHDEILNVFMESERKRDSLGSTSPDWLTDEANKPKTVAAKVEELKQRVGLVPKTASWQFPLYIKASQEQEALDQQVKDDEEDLEQIRSYIKALVDSRRGYIDAPAVLHNLREVFEKDLLDNNHDFILKSIENAKSGYTSSVGVIMPRSMGKADSRIESENDKLFPLTSDIL